MENKDSKRTVAILSGDIGATNSRLSLVSLELEGKKVVKSTEIAQHKVKTNESKTIEEWFSGILPEKGNINYPCQIVISISGLVVDNVVLDSCVEIWGKLDGAELATRFGVENVIFLNDITGAAWGLLSENTTTEVLNEGKKVESGPIAMLSQGTGTGEAVLLTSPSNGTKFVMTTEMWVAEFPSHTEQEWEIYEFMRKHNPEHPGVEAAATIGGNNMKMLYYYLLSKNDPNVMDNPPEWKTQDVFENPNQDPLLDQVKEMYFTALGKEMAVMATKYLPSGGIYLSGGVVEANVSHVLASQQLKDEYFRLASTIPALKDYPIYVVTTPDSVTLSGGIVYAQTFLI